MVYGQLGQEILSLNDDTLWAGTTPRGPNPKAAAVLPDIRRLIFEGKLEQADALAETTQGVEFCQPYLPAGHLVLDWPKDMAEQSYTRSLHLDEAVVNVDTPGMQRRYFASEPAQQIVFECQSNADPIAKLDITLGSKLTHDVQCEDGCIILSGRAPEEVFWEDVEMTTTHTHQTKYGPSSRRFAIVASVKTNSGKITSKGGTVTVTNFKDVTVSIALATDAHGSDPGAVCKETLKVTPAQAVLIADHKMSHQRLFDQISLDLCGPDTAAHSPLQNVFMFNYARYLMIVSSRADTMPANLQGIWNEDIMPPWWSNYTCNINTEMNYWMAESCGLGDCHMALVSFIESLVPSGRKTARDHFGCGGWALCHQTDYRRVTTPMGFGSGRHFPGSASWSMWPMGGAWLCLHLFERFRYGQDIVFLRDRAFPIMVEAAEFLLDWLVPDPTNAGGLTTVPSTSPENTYQASSGYRASLCKGSAMDIAIIRSLFDVVLIAAAKLNEVNDPRLARIEAVLPQLPAQTIKADGALSEFGTDVSGAEEPHRHISHLFALTPGHNMDPALYDGARNVLRQKGLTGTGWALAWKAKCWARLGEGDIAHAHLQALLSPVPATQVEMAMDGGGVFPNMLTAHPPMQIDANFGYGAALLDMLVQANETEIVLLPALPKEWVCGALQGLRLPGGGTLDVEWDEMAINCKVRRMGGQRTKFIHKCAEILVTFTTGSIEEFSFPQNPSYVRKPNV
jgi:alpha-L-fucosidase 2